MSCKHCNFSLGLSFCTFLLVAQRTCLAVSPWTLAMSTWIEVSEKYKLTKSKLGQSQYPEPDALSVPGRSR